MVEGQIVLGILQYLVYALFCVLLPGSTLAEHSDTQGPSSVSNLLNSAAGGMMSAAMSRPETFTTSSNEPAESDFDEPATAAKLAFIELFTQRLRNGAHVADLLTPEVSFAYRVESECAAVTTGHIDKMPSSDVDTGFSFTATYTWENPDCDVPSEPHMILEFNLGQTVSGWSQIEAAAEDHDFNAFSLLDRARDDYLTVYIVPTGERDAASKIEYHVEVY